MEMWLDIPGYEGIYQASNLGNIRTCEGKTTHSARHGVRRWKQRVLKQKYITNNKGRKDARITLWKEKESQTWLVSRLIGLAWCGGYADGMTINHINGNPLDNRADNLEWVTLAENIKKGFDSGLYANCQHSVRLTNKDQTIQFASQSAANRFLGRNHGYISACLKKNRPIIAADGTQYIAS